MIRHHTGIRCLLSKDLHLQGHKTKHWLRSGASTCTQASGAHGCSHLGSARALHAQFAKTMEAVLCGMAATHVLGSVMQERHLLYGGWQERSVHNDLCIGHRP